MSGFSFETSVYPSSGNDGRGRSVLARPGPWGPSGQTLNLRAHEVPLQRLPSALTGAVFAPSPASGRSRSPTGTWSRSSPTPSTPAPRPWTACTASPGPPRCPRPSGPTLCAGARGPAAGCVFWFPQGLTGSGVLDMVNNFRALRSETELLLAGRVALVSWARAPAVGGCRGRGVLAQTEFQASGSPARCGRGLGPRGDCITGSASESCGHERLCRCRRPR